jgi:hypothetical protein
MGLYPYPYPNPPPKGDTTMGGGAIMGRTIVVVEDRYVVLGTDIRAADDDDGARYAARPPTLPPLRAARTCDEPPIVNSMADAGSGGSAVELTVARSAAVAAAKAEADIPFFTAARLRPRVSTMISSSSCLEEAFTMRQEGAEADDFAGGTNDDTPTSNESNTRGRIHAILCLGREMKG